MLRDSSSTSKAKIPFETIEDGIKAWKDFLNEPAVHASVQLARFLGMNSSLQGGLLGSQTSDDSRPLFAP